MKTTLIPRLEVSMNELQDALEHARRGALSEKEYSQLKAALETLGYLTELIEDKETTLRRLRQILFGPSTEKTRKVLGELSPKEGKPGTEGSAGGWAAADGQASPTSASATTGEEGEADSGSEEKPEGARVPGHGRNGAEAYTGARKEFVPNTEVKVGQRCPLCQKGKLYELRTPGVIVRVTGQAPLTATVFELQKLRCNLCGEVFTAEPPAGVGTKKYDEAAAAMLAVLRYGRGFPFYRLEGLQNNLGVPLPASTQFEILEETSKVLAPVYEEFIRQAAQGEVMYNDDTGVKILELMKENEEKQKGKAPPDRAAGGGERKATKSDAERTGMHTTGVVSTRAGKKIALFFSGRKHAGENLGEVLKRRAQELGPPIQMCDALDYNVPKDFAVILGNCSAHARRRFVEVADNFPAECKKALDIFADVYKAEAEAQKLGLSSAERLVYHQAHSGPRMKELEEWIAAQFAERRVEPNSGLGKALKYLENHWERLTLFLRVAAAPIDNNLVERALKKAILQRKNSLFYKTENGAAVGDMFTTFIHTCELNEVNAYDYLIEVQKHADEACRNPAQWMPWNYRETLGTLELSRSCVAVA